MSRRNLFPKPSKWPVAVYSAAALLYVLVTTFSLATGRYITGLIWLAGTLIWPYTIAKTAKSYRLRRDMYDRYGGES